MRIAEKMGIKPWKYDEYEEYRKEYFPANKDMYLYIDEDQEDIIRKYSRWRSKGRYSDLAQNIKLSISANKSEKLMNLTGGIDDFIYDGFVDAGDSYCSLGHAIRYEYYALSISTGREIIFGSTCASDFFGLKKGQLYQMNKVREEILSEIQYILFLLYTENDIEYKEMYYDDLIEITKGKENVSLFTETCGADVVKFTYHLYKNGLPLPPFLVRKLEIYRVKHLWAELDRIFKEAESEDLLVYYKKMRNKIKNYSLSDRYIERYVLNGGKENYYSPTAVAKFISLDYLINEQSKLCIECEKLLWPENLLEKIDIYYTYDNDGKYHRANRSEIKSNSNIELRNETIIPDRVAFGILGALLINYKYTRTDRYRASDIIIKYLMDNSEKYMGINIEEVDGYSSATKSGHVLDAYSLHIINAIVDLSNYEGGVAKYIKDLQDIIGEQKIGLEEKKNKRDNEINASEGIKSEQMTTDDVNSNIENEGNEVHRIEFSSMDTDEKIESKQDESKLKQDEINDKNGKSVYTNDEIIKIMKAHLDIIPNNSLKKMIEGYKHETTSQMTQLQIKYMVDVFNTMLHKSMIEGMTDNNSFMSDSKSLEISKIDKHYIVVYLDYEAENGIIINASDGESRRYIELKNISKYTKNDINIEGFNSDVNIVTYMNNDKIKDIFDNKLYIGNGKKVVQAGMEMYKIMRNGKGKWPKYSEIVDYIGIDSNKIWEMVKSLSNVKIESSSDKRFNDVARCIIVELVYLYLCKYAH